MISTGTIKIKFVDHQALTNGGVWIYSVIDAVTPDGEKPTWHTIKQFYDGVTPNPKRINETYHIRINKSKREMFKDTKGEWIDKGEVFIIDEDGWASPPIPTGIAERAFNTVSDIIFTLEADKIYIYDGTDTKLATWPSGAIVTAVVNPVAFKRVNQIKALAFQELVVMI